MCYKTFVLQKGEKLEKVSLLHNKDRLHFTLLGADLDRFSQIAPGASFLDSSGSDKNSVYKVTKTVHCPQNLLL